MPYQYTLTLDRIGEDVSYLSLSPVGDDDAPVIIVLHGLGGSKEGSLHTLYRFASAGFRAIALDLPMHGDRLLSEQRDVLIQEAYFITLFQISQQAVADISQVLDHFHLKRAGIYGLSFGGIITFAALTAEPRICVATVVMGTPDWAGMLEMAGFDRQHPLFHQIEQLSPLTTAHLTYPPRPLLMLHGDLDMTVPVEGVRKLHGQLLPYYQACPDRLSLVVTPGLDHILTDEMVDRSVAWMSHFRDEFVPRS